jgi:hypothetical protein
MARPQKYTDSEISAAVQALIAEGGEINPMRVRMRLGGGNVSRIKAVIAGMPQRKAPPPLPRRLPETLIRELQQVISEAAQQTLSVMTRHWENALARSAGSATEEYVKLREQVEDLESKALTSAERLAQAETHRNEKDRVLQQITKEKAELVQSYENLQSALRNAESDFRAAQHTIEGFERNRREDRDEIRSLQRRIEDLVGEIALLKAKDAGGQRKPRSPTARSPRSRRC